MKNKAAFLILALSLLAGSAQAQSEEKMDPVGLDAAHGYISSQVEAFARQIDSVLGGDIVFEETNVSNLRFRYSWSESALGKSEEGLKVRLKLILPRTQEKLQFQITGNEEEANSEVGPSDKPPPENLQEIRDNYLAELRLIFFDNPFWRASLSGGVRVGIPSDPYVRFIMRRHETLGDWRFLLEETNFYFYNSGYSSRTFANMERLIFDPLLLRFSATALWTEETKYWNFLGSTGISQALDESSVMAYSFGTTWTSEPLFRTQEYSLDVTYRRSVYYDWLFFELKPGLAWQREHDFRPNPGITASLEMNFGEKK